MKRATALLILSAALAFAQASPRLGKGFLGQNLPKTGLKLWLDASRITGHSNGQAVATWSDVSGSGNNATGVNGPTYQTNVVNGKPTVRFSGSSQYFTHPYYGEPRTIYVVGQSTSTGNRTWMGANSDAGVALDAYYFKSADPSIYSTFMRSTTGGADFNAPAMQIPGTGFHLHMGRMSADRIENWVDGILLGADMRPAGSTVLNIAGPAAIGAGYYNSNPSDFLVGDIAELLVYDVAHTENERLVVQEYLRKKYALTYSAEPPYLMTFFNGNTSLFVGKSSNGTQWNRVEANFAPSVGTVRDPSVMLWSGRWWVAYTRYEGSFNGVVRTVIISSDDLNLWREHTTIHWPTLGNPSWNSAWAAEWFVDTDGPHLIFSATTTGTTGFKTYESHPTSTSLMAWSTPVEVTGDFPTNVIDGFVEKRASTYYLWFKDESNGYIGYATASALIGPYTVQQGGTNWSGWGSVREGQSMLKLPNNTWRMYLDNLSTIVSSDSADGLTSWSAPAALSFIGGDTSARHGTVVLR